MSQNHYQSQQLYNFLEALENKQVSGTLHLNAEINSKGKRRYRVLVLQDGRIIYGGTKVPEAHSLVKTLEQKLNREWVDAAVNFAMRQLENQTSIRVLFERLVEMQLFTWEQIESVIYNQVLLTLEEILPYPGQFKLDTSTQFRFCRGVELSKLMLAVAHRQDQWSALKPMIPSQEAVPRLEANAMEKITDGSIRQHLQQWVDGERSLIDIAQGLDKDPVNVAKSYVHWVQAGWVVMEGGTYPNSNLTLPTILAVDDSVVMQELIKRALGNCSKVVVASNAVDALNLLYREKVSLILLDVSMPEIDGLELCRTLRGITQFRDLPVIMLTARDGFFDKVKGKLSGSTEYLTKPFDAEKLREVVGKYVEVTFTSSVEVENKSQQLNLSTSS